MQQGYIPPGQEPQPRNRRSGRSSAPTQPQPAPQPYQPPQQDAQQPYQIPPQAPYQQPQQFQQPFQPAQQPVPQAQYQQYQPVQQAQSVPASLPRGKRSILLLISAVLGLIFFIVLVSGTTSLTNQRLSQTATTAEEVGFQLGTMIGAALLVPQMVATGIAVILNAVGWGVRSRGFALAGAIVYCVAAVLMIVNALFLLPSIVLSFVGYAKMGKKLDS